MSPVFGTFEHPSERTLILLVDRELSARRAARTERHLRGCQHCRNRMHGLERGLRDANRAILDSSAERPHASTSVARTRLRARLSDMQLTESTFGPALFFRPGVGRRWVAGCIALLLAVLALGRRDEQSNDRSREELAVFLLPQADRTPGATRSVSVHEVCDGHRPVRVRPIPASLHQRVFRAYGADYRRAGAYELDRLITPELGGTDDEANLWPQVFGATVWNAYVKDELERFFHERICEGRMDFATAQREIATDWIAAYKRHFDTEAPRRDYRTSPLTSLDRDLIISELGEAGLGEWQLTVGVSPYNQ